MSGSGVWSVLASIPLPGYRKDRTVIRTACLMAESRLLAERTQQRGSGQLFSRKTKMYSSAGIKK